MVGTWCMCCVYKAKVFREQKYRRFDEGQFTKVGCKTNMLKQCIIVGDLGRTALDDDRSGGRAGGWNGVVRFRVGSGLGFGFGEGEERGGKGRGVVTVPF